MRDSELLVNHAPCLRSYRMSQVLSQSGVAMGSAGSETSNAQTEKKFLSLRSAAINILASGPTEGMTPKEIYDAAVTAGLVDSSREGKTPWATLAAAFYTDIKKKARGATFRLASKGHFALTEAALSGRLTSRSSGAAKPSIGKKSKSTTNPAACLAKKFPTPTTDVRGRPLSPNTHAHGKVICGVRQKTKNGTVICRNLPIHDGEHKFEPFRNGKKSNGKNNKRTA